MTMRIEIIVRDELMEQVKACVDSIIEPREARPEVLQLNTIAGIKKMTYQMVTNEIRVCRVAESSGAINACSF